MDLQETIIRIRNLMNIILINESSTPIFPGLRDVFIKIGKKLSDIAFEVTYINKLNKNVIKKLSFEDIATHIDNALKNLLDDEGEEILRSYFNTNNGKELFSKIEAELKTMSPTDPNRIRLFNDVKELRRIKTDPAKLKIPGLKIIEVDKSLPKVENKIKNWIPKINKVITNLEKKTDDIACQVLYLINNKYSTKKITWNVLSEYINKYLNNQIDNDSKEILKMFLNTEQGELFLKKVQETSENIKIFNLLSKLKNETSKSSESIMKVGQSFAYKYNKCNRHQNYNNINLYFQGLEVIEDTKPQIGKIKLIDRNGNEFYVDEKIMKHGVDIYGNQNLYSSVENLEKDGVSVLNLVDKKDKIKLELKQFFLTNSTINDAIKRTFSQYWTQGDAKFIPGIRGFKTIGEIMGGEESWSVLNFFGTQTDVLLKFKSLLENNKPKNNEEAISSVAELLKDDKILNDLVEIQKQTLIKGFKNENETVKILENKKVFEELSRTGFGTRVDFQSGVDLVVKNSDNVSKNLQIKETNSVYKKNGEYNVYITDAKKTKYNESIVDGFVINDTKNKKIYIFDNKSPKMYENKIIFRNEPTNIIDY